MREYTKDFLYNMGIHTQEEFNEGYVPRPSEEALICLNCTKETCRPNNCKRYDEELAKIRGKQ